MERFFRSLKEECIWQHRFESLAHARHVVSQWIRFYNDERPHQSLGYAVPSAHPALASEGVQKPESQYTTPRRTTIASLMASDGNFLYTMLVSQ
jgi:putative transposase